MSLYRALVSFSGEVAGAPGQVVAISDKDVAKDYLKAGYIEALSKDEEAAEQSRIDDENKRQAEAEKTRAEAAKRDADEEAARAAELAGEGRSAAQTQAALNAELAGQNGEGEGNDEGDAPVKPLTKAELLAQAKEEGLELEGITNRSKVDEITAAIEAARAAKTGDGEGSEGDDEEGDGKGDEPRYQYRSSVTGQLVTEEEAKANPDTTVREKVTE